MDEHIIEAYISRYEDASENSVEGKIAALLAQLRTQAKVSRASFDLTGNMVIPFWDLLLTREEQAIYHPR